jgi:hypothetical protein
MFFTWTQYTYVPWLSWKSRSSVGVPQLEVSVLVILAIDVVSLWSFFLRVHNRLARNVCHIDLAGVKGSPATPQFHRAQTVRALNLYNQENDNNYALSIAKITPEAIKVCHWLPTEEHQLRNDSSNWGTLSTEARNTRMYMYSMIKHDMNAMFHFQLPASSMRQLITPEGSYERTRVCTFLNFYLSWWFAICICKVMAHENDLTN